MALVGQTMKPLVNLGEDNTDCWEWIGTVNQKTGYGKKTVNGKAVLAHRWIYESLMGTISEGMVINHKCSNRRCVSPLHLEAVTQADNCRHGAETKLTKIQAKTIKRLKGNKTKGVRNILASRYNVSRQLIYDIWAGRAWRNI